MGVDRTSRQLPNEALQRSGTSLAPAGFWRTRQVGRAGRVPSLGGCRRIRRAAGSAIWESLDAALRCADPCDEATVIRLRARSSRARKQTRIMPEVPTIGTGTGPGRPLEQKTIGLIGGSSDQATAEYYRLLNEGVNARLGGWEIAETMIAGMNFGNIEHYMRHGAWEACAEYVSNKIDRLIAAGVDVIICVSNTLHRVVEPAMARRRTPFIHIVDPTGDAIQASGLRRVALLGTKAVMSMPYLRTRYEEGFDLELMVPTDAEQDDIDRIIFDEPCRGLIAPASKARYLGIVDRMAAAGAQGLILGCTEIFLLIGQEDRPAFPMLNTTQLHAEAAVAFALRDGLGKAIR